MKKILIIDDDESHLDVLQLLFQDEGYQVLLKDGPKDLEMVMDEFLPDLVVLDIMMGKFNGADICQRIKNSPRFAGIKVLLMTASFVFNDLKVDTTLADAHISKPFHLNELVRVVENLVNG